LRVNWRKMPKKVLHIILIIAMMVPSMARAQYAGSGSSAFAFLDLPISSKMAALGGANVSLRDGDVTLAMNNPSLLGTMTDKVLALNYAYYLPGMMFGSALYGHNFGRSKIEKHPDEPDKPNYFAVGIHYLDYGTMQYASEQGDLTGGSFSARDILIDAMYARQLSPNFSIGVTLKPIMSFYESYSSFALGADVGFHFQLKDSTFQLGLCLQNIGWQLKGFYSEEGGTARQMLPLNLQLGFNYRFKHAPIRLGMTIHNMQCWNIGYEYTNVKTDENTDIAWYDMMFRHTIFFLDIVPRNDRFYITLSYNHRRRAELAIKDQRSFAGFAIGAGVRIYKFRIGFATYQATKSNLSYQVSLALDINSMLQ